MIATSFDESNDFLNPPKDMTPEECSALSIWRGPLLFEGMALPITTVISCWKPTKEELEEINKTGRVWLVVLGPTMPPACLLGINPLKVNDDKFNED